MLQIKKLKKKLKEKNQKEEKITDEGLTVIVNKKN